MSGRVAETTAYLQPRAGSFWCWSEDGEAVEWRGGSTIAFRREVREILWRLAPEGLPGFDLVVLTLAACRDDFRSELLKRVPEAHQVLFPVPTSLKRGPLGKATLLSLALRQHRIVPAASAESLLLAWHRDAFPALLPVERSGTPPRLELLILQLRVGLRRVHEDQASMRLATSLEEPLLPADPSELPPTAETVRSCLESLREDSALRGVARIAREVLGALPAPQASERLDEAFDGGIADLANRGAFDRLLTSELAHEDEVMLARIVLGEALYVRREPARRHQDGARIVVLDVGLRMWGIPRIYGAATALALGASSPRQRSVECWIATESGHRVVALTQRSGVATMLAELSTTTHPGLALADLVQTVATSRRLGEVFVVTHPDVLRDPEFSRALAAATRVLPELRVVTVDRDGELRVDAVSTRGTHPLARARLDLDPILPRGSATPERQGLPSILFDPRFPLRLPHSPERARLRRDGRGGILSLTRDRCLVHGESPFGATGLGKLLTAAIPAGKLRYFSNAYGDSVLLVLQTSDTLAKVVTVELPTGETRSAEVTIERMHEATFVFRDPKLFIVTRDSILAFDTSLGVMLDRTPLRPGLQSRELHALLFCAPNSSTDLWFEHGLEQPFVAVPRPLGHKRPTPIIDVAGQPPRFLLRDGSLAFVVNGNPDPWSRKRHQDLVIMSVLAADEYGRHLLVSTPQGYVSGVVHRETSSAVIWWSAPELSVKDTGWTFGEDGVLLAHPFETVPALHHYVDGIALVGGSIVVRGTREAERWRLTGTGSDGGALAWAVAIQDETLFTEFSPILTPSGHGYRLSIATWPSGSHAFFDSRGLLHLVSHDPRLAQLTIVLVKDAPAAIWSSRGHGHGAETFFEQDEQVGREVVLRELAEFIGAALGESAP